MVKAELKNGVVREYEDGATLADVAKSLGGGIFKKTCAGVINGEVKDLRTPIDTDGKCTVELLTFDDLQGKKAFWHTASHVLAQAVKHLYPNAKLAIGPSIDD